MPKKLLVIVGVAMIVIVWVAISTSHKKVATPTANANSGPLPYDQLVTMTDFTFTPKEFTAGSSQTIKVKLQNDGQVGHSFVFTTLDFSSGIIAPGKSSIVTFTVPAKAGRYDFHSTGPDAKDKNMTGAVVVR